MRARTSYIRPPTLPRVAAILTLALGSLAACSGAGDQARDAQALSAGAIAGATAADSFAIRAERGARIEEGAAVSGGDVGIVEPPPASNAWSLRVDTHATIGEGARIVAPAVLLDRGATAGEVLTDRLQDRGSTHGAVSSFAAVPAVEPLAAIDAGADVSPVSCDASAPLPGGRYGDVVVSPDAVLRLEGGEYELASLRVAPGGSIVALSPVRVRVETSLEAGSRSRISIQEGAGTARDLRIEVAGAGAPGAPLEDSSVVARIGERSVVRALVSAPGGVLVVGARASFTGAIVADGVLVRTRASVVFEDGFADPVCAGGCDDDDPCTADSCVAGACRHEPLSAGTSCSDADGCNGEETCDDQGACLAGTPPAVDDGNACTADSCDPVLGVVHVPLAAGAGCSDGNACNGLETCDGRGSCLAGTGPVMDDGNACTADSCDPVLGVVHVPLAAGASCADGNACNGLETCDGQGSCLAGTGPVVDDGNACTADSCDPTLGVVHVPLAAGASCADLDPCNGVETCDGAGACLPGIPPSLDDGNFCTIDVCRPLEGVLHIPLPGCIPPPSGW